MGDASAQDTAYEYNTLSLLFLKKSFLVIKSQGKTIFFITHSMLMVHMTFYYRIQLASPDLGENEVT